MLLSILAAVLLLAGFAITPPMVQNPAYHQFASHQTHWGVTNFWNVVSNLPFFLVAAAAIHRRDTGRILPAAIAGVGAGSAYYHLHPDNARLFWDRLPMAVVFMTMVASLIRQRVNQALGKRLLLPLIAAGLGSVIIWRMTGDLRLYGVVQFGSILVWLILLVRFPGQRTENLRLWATAILYLLAKCLEMFDHQFTSVTSAGGHPWKHVAAAGALGIYVLLPEGRGRKKCE